MPDQVPAYRIKQPIKLSVYLCSVIIVSIRQKGMLSETIVFDEFELELNRHQVKVTRTNKIC